MGFACEPSLLFGGGTYGPALQMRWSSTHTNATRTQGSSSQENTYQEGARGKDSWVVSSAEKDGGEGTARRNRPGKVSVDAGDNASAELL